MTRLYVLGCCSGDNSEGIYTLARSLVPKDYPDVPSSAVPATADRSVMLGLMARILAYRLNKPSLIEAPGLIIEIKPDTTSMPELSSKLIYDEKDAWPGWMECSRPNLNSLVPRVKASGFGLRNGRIEPYHKLLLPLPLGKEENEQLLADLRSTRWLSEPSQVRVIPLDHITQVVEHFSTYRWWRPLERAMRRDEYGARKDIPTEFKPLADMLRLLAPVFYDYRLCIVESEI